MAFSTCRHSQETHILECSLNSPLCNMLAMLPAFSQQRNERIDGRRCQGLGEGVGRPSMTGLISKVQMHAQMPGTAYPTDQK